MKRILIVIGFFVLCVSGCGYATRTVSPTMADIKTIYVAPLKNNVDYGTERSTKNLYVPMMEVKATNAIIDRFVTDGFLKIAKIDDADIILKGELLNYQRDGLRYDDNDNAQEYRITVIVSLVLTNAHTNEVIWKEPGFAGTSTYFLTGPSAKSESLAIDDAVKDLAQRIIERTVEDW